MNVATYIICHTAVDHQDRLLSDERFSIALAFLERATTTHLCNHKLTSEGIVYEYQGEPFRLKEEYKTITLTRSVYEHLAMFYFLYEHPRTVVERDIVWKYWLINSKLGKLGAYKGKDPQILGEIRTTREEIKHLRQEILATPVGQACGKELQRLISSNNTQTGSLQIRRHGEKYLLQRLSFSQAWRWLYPEADGDDGLLSLEYRYLSMHSHPVYDGLLQYQSQTDVTDDDEQESLFFSSCFLARLCSLFLHQIPQGEQLLAHRFSREEQFAFYALAQMKGVGKE